MTLPLHEADRSLHIPFSPFDMHLPFDNSKDSACGSIPLRLQAHLLRS